MGNMPKERNWERNVEMHKYRTMLITKSYLGFLIIDDMFYMFC